MIKKVIPFLVSSLFLLASCDYITDPIQDGGSNGNDTTKVMRNILIDDFTGIKCVNCPDATEVIHTLQNNAQFEGRLFALAIHTEYFAVPLPPQLPDDFRTVDGDALGSLFGITSAVALPKGMINRKEYPDTHIKNYPDWPNEAATFLPLEAIVDVQPSTTYNSSNKKVNISVDLTWMEDIESESFNIVAIVSEDKIIGSQLTHGNPSVDPNYEFNHTLRKSSNGITGEAVGSANIFAGDQETYTTSVILDDEWVADNCNILVYVYNTATQEIMQVNQVPVN